ncbi:hypothetical protein GEMRC1_002399 [Eukaryota sp. GEM-RC1]
MKTSSVLICLVFLLTVTSSSLIYTFPDISSHFSVTDDKLLIGTKLPNSGRISMVDLSDSSVSWSISTPSHPVHFFDHKLSKSLDLVVSHSITDSQHRFTAISGSSGKIFWDIPIISSSTQTLSWKSQKFFVVLSDKSLHLIGLNGLVTDCPLELANPSLLFAVQTADNTVSIVVFDEESLSGVVLQKTSCVMESFEVSSYDSLADVITSTSFKSLFPSNDDVTTILEEDSPATTVEIESTDPTFVKIRNSNYEAQFLKTPFSNGITLTDGSILSISNKQAYLYNGTTITSFELPFGLVQIPNSMDLVLIVLHLFDQINW